jgi:hypothetical protein
MGAHPRRSRAKLTRELIEGLEYRGGQDIQWDSEVPGFGVRINPNGSKRYVIGLDTIGKKFLRVIGSYPELDAERARKAALRLLADLKALRAKGTEAIKHGAIRVLQKIPVLVVGDYEPTEPGPLLVSEKDLHERFGFTPRFWQERRVRRDGPPYLRISEKTVRYRLSDVERWLAEKETI